MRFNNETTVSASSSQDQGNAMVEFLGIGFILMVPTMYFLLAVFSLQSGAMAANAASQQAVQMIQAADSNSLSDEQIHRVASFAAKDYSVQPEEVSVVVHCEGDCATSNAVTADVTVNVQLPLIPGANNAQLAQLSSSSTAWGGKYQ